jgi:5-carboxymethyl-2-hydroxymuconate isomerase
MIRLTLEFTDNLGPEADFRALLARLDNRLRAAVAGEAHILVDARLLADYVADVADGAWATVILTLRGPAALADVLNGCAQDICNMAETHLTEIYLRRSVVVSLQVELVAAAPIERRHAKPPGVSF